jgi:tRNA pseudouridine synthase 10
MGSPPGFDDLPDPWRGRAREVVEQAAESARREVGGLEAASFRIATTPIVELEERPALHDRVRAVLRVELRHALEAAWPQRRFEPDEPDVIVEVLAHGEVRLEPQAAFVAGRYRKLSREMSQTALHCRRCRGRGRRRGEPCDACGGSGRAVAEAVEDFVVPAIVAALHGEEGSFHGSGREDVDVRMLGDGRPFVVSVQRSRRRSFAPEAIAEQVRARSGGSVEVAALRLVDRAQRKRITTEHGVKTYRVVVEPVGDARLPDDAAARVAALSGTVLEQRNPKRVPRRADVLRRRTVRHVAVEEAASARLVARVVTDPGLYVKELVSGDEGRTRPSIADAVGVPVTCTALDVLGVTPDEPEPDAQASR